MPPRWRVTDFASPRDVTELADALRRATPLSRIIAGGTDLVLSLQRSDPPDLLIDITHVAGLGDVRLDGGTVHVGALATFGQLHSHPVIVAHAPCLAQAAARVGSLQIRNSATIGGNVANASPCGDSLPALAALGAQVDVLDASGSVTSRPLGELLIGQARTNLRASECITAFRFPALAADQRSGFAKIGARNTVTVSKLSAAAVVDVDAASGLLGNARVALGAVAPTTFRDASLEAVLNGAEPTSRTAAAFAATCVAAVQRAIPTRPSLAYKQHAAAGLAYDVWNALGVCPPCEPVWGG